MREEITYDDIYEIAEEVAIETVKKFLKNLIKLVPTEDEVDDSIKNSQYEELKQFRENSNQRTYSAAEKAEKRSLAESIIIPTDDDEFANIAHPGKASGAADINNMDDALSQISLEKSDLLGQAASSACIE